MCTWVLQLIPMTNLMNVSCSCLSNLTLYLPELEVRRFNYLMSPLPSCLSLRRVKIDRHCESLDSNLLLRIMRMDDSVRRRWIFLVDWLLNSSLYRNVFHFVIFWAPSSDDDSVWIDPIDSAPQNCDARSHLLKMIGFCSDLPLGWRVSPRVHAGPVGAGEAEGVAHASWSRRGRFGLNSRFRGTELTIRRCLIF